VQIIKDGNSLVSIEENNLAIKWLFKNEFVEVLTLEIGPQAILTEPYIYQSQGVHYILRGELIFETDTESHILMKGDLLWSDSSNFFRIKNLTNFKGIIYTLLFEPPSIRSP
jgi:mannose-6-phosphate isomerase-like protein (cupin superfamily)